MKTNKRRKRKLTAKDFMAMNAKQLARATKQFDEEFIADQSRPLTAEERAQWSRLKRKPGRPKVGKGVKIISVSLEKDLLAKADKLAKQQGISRAKLISRGLETVLAKNGRKLGK
jgi:hypothetical protein